MVPEEGEAMSRRRWLSVAAGITALSAAAMLGITAGPAAASTDAPSGCTYDLCYTVPAQTYNTLYLYTYVNNQSVYGHFEVQTPEGTARNSPTDTYSPNGLRGYTFSLPYGSNADYGTYCITLWKQVGSSYDAIARGCSVL